MSTIHYFDKCKVYKFVMRGGIGYACEIGESASESSSQIMLAVFENLYDKEIAPTELIRDSHYYITHTSSFGIEAQLKGVAKQNKVCGNEYVVEYSFADFDKCRIVKTTALASFAGECENSFKINTDIRYRMNEFNFIRHSYRWLTMDEGYKLVRSQSSDRGIVLLPPYFQSVETCLQWWAEELTIKKWTDEYCKQIVLLRKHTDNEHSDKTTILNDIISSLSELDNEHMIRLKAMMLQFEYKFLKIKTEEDAEKLLKKLYSEMHKYRLDSKIDTDGREVLFEYINQILQDAGFESVMERCEWKRNW